MSRDIEALPRTPANHFRLHAHAAILALRDLLPEAPLPFLASYYDELDGAGTGDWWARVRRWEDGALPLARLRKAYTLDELALTLLFTAGLPHEDGRFAQLFELLNGVVGATRPTPSLLAGWSDDEHARDALHAVAVAGLLVSAEGGVEVPPVLWEAMRGRAPLVDWARYRARDELPPLGDLLLPDETASALARAPSLLDEHSTIVVRGPRSSGRRTVVASLARELGRGLLELDEAHALAGPLATLLHALPLVVVEPAPGETVDVPQLRGCTGPVAVVAGRSGGVRAEHALMVQLDVPDVELREAHWRAALGDGDLARRLAPAVRTTSGTIHRVAGLARAEAALAGRERPGADDVRAAYRRVETQELETLATHVPATGGWERLAVGDETARELQLLERRCRVREQLALDAELTPGVRALFSGPTGTGKTLAARLLAAQLGKEMFSIDLATVVDKYLGETEKNLDAVFSRAEELDVVLLLDEGDALMTRRTDVQTSNDRYANLETNFLLQRLESYEGILVVTTNAGERIDSAFRRRLDVVVEFRAPDAAERWSIWHLHLPPDHGVDDSFLDEVAARCQLSGGQIRNAVLHATLLALEDDGYLEVAHLDAAIRREYRKAGSVCPLRAAVMYG